MGPVFIKGLAVNPSLRILSLLLAKQATISFQPTKMCSQKQSQKKWKSGGRWLRSAFEMAHDALTYKINFVRKCMKIIKIFISVTKHKKRHPVTFAF